MASSSPSPRSAPRFGDYSSSLDELHVFKTKSAPNGLIATEELVYCPFASRAMLERLAIAKNKMLKLVVDSKQKLFTNGYGILTFAFLATSEAPSWTTILVEGHCKRQLELHT